MIKFSIKVDDRSMKNVIGKLAGSNILITGATGFIGGLLADELLSWNKEYHAGIRLVLPVRNMRKAKERYPEDKDEYKSVTLVEVSLEELKPDKLDMPVDYIIHCASATASAQMISDPVGVADGIVLGTKNVLELARIKKIKSMAYLSSMEVYGTVNHGKDDGRLIDESTLGDLNIFSARSCYPLGKRMAEHYCHIYFKQYGVPVKIARLAQVFGYGVRRSDGRVFAQFAKAVINNEDIVLHTPGLSMGNYCESMDAVNAILLILVKGQNGEAYNVTNEENTMTIRDMADLVADKIASGKIKVVYDIPKDNIYGYAADTNIRLSSEKLRNLGWKPTKNLEEMYRDMIAYMCRDGNSRP
ncbi:MAG: NAD(P)-dependent oxidoreductase [Clostridiales bacterium]|nr:NAD(P)-dependent oxidoreductase [Clostridiales bacterium]